MNRTLVIVGALVLAGVVGTAVYLRSRGATATTGNGPRQADDPQAVGVETLRRHTDLISCKSALQQFNAHVEEKPQRRPATLSPEESARLRETLGLSTSELSELSSTSFTPLDAHHLELCFLLRDAVNALPPATTKQETAATAFAWLMRQVRLKRPPAEEGEGWLPPDRREDDLETLPLWLPLVLRRGSGSPLERSLLFLALLEQLGLDGCLVGDGDERRPRYWACGVLGEGDQVYLFDTRLGQPLPGPGGKGIATLADVQRDPAVLAQLTFPDKQQYDVTPEQARRAELHLVSPLSSLAPRMKTLEEEFLPPVVKVRLSDDPLAARTRFARAQSGTGGAVPVRHARWATGLLRRALPVDEGGTDRTRWRDMALIRMARLDYLLRVIPEAQAQPGEPYPEHLRRLSVPPLSQIVEGYRLSIITPLIEPNKPRDTVLRGRLEESIRELGTQIDRLDFQHSQFQKNFNPQRLREWFEKSQAAYARYIRADREGDRVAAQQARSEIEQAARDHQKELEALILGAASVPGMMEMAYLRAVALHDQAERLSGRLAAGKAGDEERGRRAEEAQRLWREVLSLWGSVQADFPKEPEVHAVRLHRARAVEAMRQLALIQAAEEEGDQKAAHLKRAEELRQQEKAAWEEIARESTDLPRVIALYRAQALK